MTAPRACPHCGFLNTAGRHICKSCGKSLDEAPATPAEVVAAGPKSIEERRAILQRELVSQTSAGWRVVTQTDTSAQLEREIPPNGLITLVLLLLAILPGVLYAIFGKRRQGMFIAVDEYGQVMRRVS